LVSSLALLGLTGLTVLFLMVLADKSRIRKRAAYGFV